MNPLQHQWPGALVSILLVGGLLPAQDFAPPDSKAPDAATVKLIKEKTARLGKAIGSLRKQGIRDPLLADIEIYHQAGLAIVQHDEFFQAESAAWTLEALDRGTVRALLMAQGEYPWGNARGHAVVRGYRSRIDGSVQPYAVTLPAAYGKEPAQRWRIDVVLHGRDKSLNEVKFLRQHNGDKAAPAEQDFIRLDIYGRGNNAYRWAGEVDVFEALDNFLAVERGLGRGGLPDLSRVVLRGFSMGGAGTWHLGLHWPDKWCVLGPGAGFTTTHGYIKTLPDKLPWYQEACLRIYDAVDYAENAFNVPIVAYSGAKDPQMQAAVNIEQRLKPLGIPMTLLVAPDLEHKFPPEWQKKAEAHYAKYAAKGRPDFPERVNFVTYTLRYPSCHWLTVLGLQRHYQKAQVDAERTGAGFKIHTENVRALHLNMPEGAPGLLAIDIDGQRVDARPSVAPNGSAHVYLLRHVTSGWKSALPQLWATYRTQRTQKIGGLQGPIDDAFSDAFVCVRGTDKPWHEATQKYADANLERFAREWAKYFRGQLPIKDDIDVNDEDIARKHLVLFGDPASNSLIAQVLDRLPLQWTKEEIAFAGKKYPADSHVPVLIYPSPLNPTRYVVLNSGHTFHAADFQGTNALLYPRLGDYAILRPRPTERDPLAVEVASAGLFDDYWRLIKE
jgi:predicted esterase